MDIAAGDRCFAALCWQRKPLQHLVKQPEVETVPVQPVPYPFTGKVRPRGADRSCPLKDRRRAGVLAGTLRKTS